MSKNAIAVEIRGEDIIFIYDDGSEYNSGAEPGEDTWEVAQWLANEADAKLRYPLTCEVRFFEEIPIQ